MTDAMQPAGWRTKPAPFFLGEEEQHEKADVGYVVDGAIDVGIEHRRVVGLYPPEMRLDLFDDARQHDEF